MIIIGSRKLSEFPDLSFGFSTMHNNGLGPPYFFNMSYSVGDNEKLVTENRRDFFDALGLELENVAYQYQIHGDTITYTEKGGSAGESDAMITDKPGIGLAVSSADCAAIFIYDEKRKVVAAIHSGWRGTVKKIVKKTIKRLVRDFNCSPADMTAYIAPSIGKLNYEVGAEVAEQFSDKYLEPAGEKFLLDVAGANYDMLIESGLNADRVDKSKLCSHELSELFHSYRRDGQVSGRALGVIAIKEN